ncbi:hypothetical protein [Gorillibacterium sp. sgz5001074]|uniref:hypothetical protein n=1 Tax=Gorillibacterium sp. sgz5001074 TaxID=3446695 RepID=UPI003F66A8F3
MAETYRKSKVEYYLARLELRKNVLTEQLDKHGFEDKHDFIQGQISALELVVKEIKLEFELMNPKSNQEEST